MKIMNKRIIILIIALMFVGVSNIKAYNTGDMVTYKDNKYYVVSADNEKVTLLKFKSLKTEEVNLYGEGHVNAYSKINRGSATSGLYYEREAVDYAGYGKIAFYQDDMCKIYEEQVSESCNNEYANSDIKYVIDEWAKNNVDSEDLVTDSTGYSVRLLTVDELVNSFGFEYRNLNDSASVMTYVKSSNTPIWLYSISYWLMTMADNNTDIYCMTSDGVLEKTISYLPELVRPVITLSKQSLDLKNTKKSFILNNDINEINYGKKYVEGDTVIYNGIKFTVIKDSDDDNDSVLLIKNEPLTLDEVLQNGVGYINKSLSNEGNPDNLNGYGSVAYYSSDTCNVSDNSGCTNSYEDSHIKHILDEWVLNNLKNNNIDLSNINVRIISKSDLEDIFRYTITRTAPGGTTGYEIYYRPPILVQYDLSNCLTSSSINDDNDSVWHGNGKNAFKDRYVYNPGTICPIISIKKQLIKKDSNDLVNVPDTKLYKKIMFLLSGIVIILLSIVLLFIKKKLVIVKNENE